MSGGQADGYTLEKRYGQYWGRVTLPDGDRPRVPLGIRVDKRASEERQKESRRAALEKLAGLVAAGRRDGNLAALVARARERAGLVDKVRVAAPPGVTVAELAKKWWTGELFRTHGDVNGLKVKRSAESDRLRFEGSKGVAAVKVRGSTTFGALLVSDVTEEDLELVFAALPRDWRPATRIKVYAMLHRLFGLAIAPCRLRKDNPVPPHLRPGKGSGLLLQYPYPSEILAVLGRTGVPLGRRVLYAVAAYTGLRKSTLRALTWADVDLERGVVRALVTKTDMPQVFALELPGLLHVVKGWRDRCGATDPKAPVFRMLGIEWERLAQSLQDDLRAAGVTRPELFESDAKSRALRFHDLRAAFVTMATRAGRGLGWISDRTGHLDPKMVQRYTRAARTLADLDIVPFPDLTSAIPELAPTPAPAGEDAAPGADVPAAPARRNEHLRTDDRAVAPAPWQPIAPERAVSARNPPIQVPVAARLWGFKSPSSHQAEIAAEVTGPAAAAAAPEDAAGTGTGDSAPPADVVGVAPIDPIDAALADGLVNAQRTAAAAAAERVWDIARAQTALAEVLAREIEARRVARAGSNVVPLDRARRGAT